MRRWFVTVFVVVVILAFVLGGTLQVILSLQPPDQTGSVLPFALATAITVFIANAIIAIMQWFGVSPLDFLPAPTLEDQLRKQDRARLMLTRSTNADLIKEQARVAKKLKHHEWAYVYARAWVRLKPQEADAFDYLGDAAIELGYYDEALQAGNNMIRLEPLNHNGFDIVSKAYEQLGDRQKALEYCLKALGVASPTFQPFVLSRLSALYQKLGMVSEAANALEKVITLQEKESLTEYDRKALENLRLIQAQRVGIPMPNTEQKPNAPHE